MSLLRARHMLGRLRLVNRNRHSRAQVTIDTETDGAKIIHRPPVLPTLLWEMVIDFVVDTDTMDFWYPEVRDTLRSCSLTCRAWTPRSQYHLFHTILVNCSTRGKRDVKHLVALLTKHRALHTNVRILVVRAGKSNKPTLNELPNGLAPLLPQLSTLRFSHLYLKPAPGETFTISLRQFTSVTTLDLHNVVINSLPCLQRTISAMTGLKTLAFAFATWNGAAPGPVWQTTSESPVRLQTLELRGHALWIRDNRTVQFFQWLILSRTASSLERITLHSSMILNDSMLAAVEMMAEGARASLKTLTLSFGPYVDFIRCKFLLPAYETFPH